MLRNRLIDKLTKLMVPAHTVNAAVRKERSVGGLERLMRPVVQEYLRSMSRDANEWAKNATQWYLNHSDDREKHDLKFQTLCQILLASMGTDAMSIIVGDIWVH